MSFRDSTVIVIETGRTVIRAGLGLHELLKTPSLEFPARVGLRKSIAVNGHSSNGNIPHASTSRTSSLPQHYQPSASVNDYLVGVHLDEALAAGQDILISWPFADGDVRDWTQAEAIWKHVLFNQLQRRRVQNESPVLLSIAPGLARHTYERICQIFFERFNVAGLSILERPMSQIYAANSLSGVVVDIDQEKTDVTPIYDGFILHNARFTTSIGIRDCENYLAHLWKSNASVISSLALSTADPETLHSTLLDLAKYVWTEGYIKVPSSGEAVIVEDEGITDIAAAVVNAKDIKAVIESGIKRKATKASATAAEQARAREIEALDLVTIQFREHSITLGKERHRFCEPLFDPRVLDGLGLPGLESSARQLPLQEAVGCAVAETEVDQRHYIWTGLFVTGDLTRHVKGIGIALQSRLAPYIVSNPDQYSQNDIQARAVKVLGIPEYYPEYRGTGDGLAAFLGSSITAKIVFSEAIGSGKSLNFVTKAEYASKGPHAIIEMASSLL